MLQFSEMIDFKKHLVQVLLAVLPSSLLIH